MRATSVAEIRGRLCVRKLCRQELNGRGDADARESGECVRCAGRIRPG